MMARNLRSLRLNLLCHHFHRLLTLSSVASWVCSLPHPATFSSSKSTTPKDFFKESVANLESSGIRGTDETALIPGRIKHAKYERLEKIISNRGLGSRKHVAKLFRRGLVSVNGIVIRSGSQKFPPNATTVIVDGVASHPPPLLAAFHKPTNMHSTMGDPLGRTSLIELLLENSFLKDMHPVGRLDADSSGLLLFSSNGKLTQQILNPDTGIEREYEALVTGSADFNSLSKKLAGGIATSEGTFSANLVAVVPLSVSPMERIVVHGETNAESVATAVCMERAEAKGNSGKNPQSRNAAINFQRHRCLQVNRESVGNDTEFIHAAEMLVANLDVAEYAKLVSRYTNLLSLPSANQDFESVAPVQSLHTTEEITAVQEENESVARLESLKSDGGKMPPSAQPSESSSSSLTTTLPPCSYVRVVVTEGKYRMVRRILHNAGGHSVLMLRRVRFGEVCLNPGSLEEGAIRSCTDREQEWAQRLLYGCRKY